MIPQAIRPDADVGAICDLCARWGICTELGHKLHAMAAYLPFPLTIFSGYRTAEQQADAGPTAAPEHLSNHRVCPARAADIGTPDDDEETKITLGRAAELAGLRWGGGAPRKNNIPVGVEWRHVDLGPRSG